MHSAVKFDDPDAINADTIGQFEINGHPHSLRSSTVGARPKIGRTLRTVADQRR
jgi:hypothetical protein